MSDQDAEYTQTTIDMDRPTGLSILVVWHRLAEIGAVDGRISASGTGIHLRCRHPPMSMRESMLIRYQCQDDAMRIGYDESAPESKPKMILFDAKRGAYADEWLSDPIRLIDRYGALV